MGNYRIDYQKNAYYHIYNRGYMRADLFHTPRDYEKYVSIIDEVMSEYPMISVIIYCLLPNHFHFLLQQTQDGLYIADFMRRIQGAFANYYKVKYKKTRGLPLYEGRYRAKLLPTDKDLLQCHSYILHNPVKHQLTDDVDSWPYLFLKRPVSLYIHA